MPPATGRAALLIISALQKPDPRMSGSWWGNRIINPGARYDNELISNNVQRTPSENFEYRTPKFFLHYSIFKIGYSILNFFIYTASFFTTYLGSINPASMSQINPGNLVNGISIINFGNTMLKQLASPMSAINMPMITSHFGK